MPRRKRNRRRHGRNKKKRQTTTIKNRASSKPNNTTNTDSSMQTCNSDEHNISCTLVNNDFMTPKVERVRKDSFEMETPVRKLQPKDEADDLQNQTADLFQNNYTPLRGTPVNKRRSLNRHKDGTLNVTNLNVLFDSNEATPIRRTSLIVKNNRTPRSHSSIPVLHSPGKEALVSFNKSTQTMDEELIVLDITETPKMSQKTHDKSNMSIKTQSNYTKNFYNQKINDMNVNPHLKDKEIANIKSQWQKESSLEELSFFSPQLYEMKTSSTPIQGQVVNYLKENDTKISLINKKLDGTPLNRDIISKTPRSAKLLEQVLNNSIDLTIMDSVPSRLDNVNLNTPPLTEKVINKDKSNSIRLLGSSKKKKRTSPKINRLVNHSRVFTKNLSRSTISSRRLSLEHSCEARSPTAGLGVYEKMVNKIKRYSKASVKWSGRMMESCAQLGIQIKNSLHSPGKEALVSFNKSTQTMDEELIVLDITETPKMSQKTHDKSNMSIKTRSNYTKNFYNQKINDMNVNPHLKDKEIANIKSQWQKESSLEELSFFSPQLYEMKTSSTPIQGQVVNYLKENDTKISLINKKLDGTPLNRDIISKTPRSAKLLEQVLNNSIDLTIMDSVPSRLDNVNLNTPPLTEKVINKDKSNSIRLLGSSKKKKRTSPKINRLVNHSRVFTKNLSRSTISSRRLSLEHSCEARSPTAGLGVYEKMVNKIKRYSKASVKWSGRMMESCAQLGIQIKNSLHSPGKEALVSFNKSTQTMDEELIVLDITETPKMSQKTHDKSNMSIKTRSNYTKNFYNQKINDMNVNPHLKDKEIANIKSQWQKESSLEELSFFSPQLYEMKTSSTPIQGQVVNYLKENDTKISLINKKLDGTPLNRDIISKTPRSAKLLEQVLNNSIDLTIMDSVPSRLDNVNLNTPPLTEKVINKDKSNSIRLLGSSKKKKRTSPKINRLVNHSRVFTKNLSRSTISSRRLSLEHSCEARSPTAGLGVYEKMVNKIKRYSKASVKWSGRMMESCAQLGIQIKNSLSSLCDMYNEKSMLESSQSQKSCQCDSLKQEIVDLNVKIDHLTEEVGHLRQQIRENHNDSQANGYHNNYQILNENLDKVKQELTTFKDLRSELTTLKEMFQCFKNTAPPPTACSVTKPPAAPPVPAPPPPPPPPPPPMPLITVPPKLNLQKKSKSTIGMTSTDNSRPVISLDDILKVKLKKASERPASTPNCRHRNISTPMCSTGDLFRQIKLRSGKPSFLKTPAINQTSASTPGVGTTTADLTTSPANSLNKFLENTSVWRVKRLKKVGAYSFDNSVHRRTMLALSPASRRERPAN